VTVGRLAGGCFRFATTDGRSLAVFVVVFERFPGLKVLMLLLYLVYKYR